MSDKEVVLVKVQRPLYVSRGIKQQCLAYIVEKGTLERLGAPMLFTPSKRELKKLFGKHLEETKVYCEGLYDSNNKHLELDTEIVVKGSDYE